LVCQSGLPVVAEDLARLGVDDVDDDASVAPAPLEEVAVLVALAGAEGLVQEGPGELLLAVDLQRAAGAHAHVLAAEVVVLGVVCVVRPGENQDITFTFYISGIWQTLLSKATYKEYIC